MFKPIARHVPLTSVDMDNEWISQLTLFSFYFISFSHFRIFLCFVPIRGSRLGGDHD